jgi:SIT family siderophore-iron:H+ symporter-like MFS transporter
MFMGTSWLPFEPALLHTDPPRLDGSTRYTYQSTATSAFGASAQISTVSVVRAIVAAAAQPAYAKISDYFGRVSILLISSIFYVIGEYPFSSSSKDMWVKD